MSDSRRAALLTVHAKRRGWVAAIDVIAMLSAFQVDATPVVATPAGAERGPGQRASSNRLACASASFCVQGEGVIAERVDGTWTSAFELNPWDYVGAFACPSVQFCLALDGAETYLGTPRSA